MQLQNNNTNQFKRNSGTAQKQSPYIEETKATNLFAPDNSNIIMGTIGNAMNTLSKTMTAYETKSQEIESINKTNDWLADYTNLTKEYQFNYSKNPQDKELTKVYENNLKNLKLQYEKQIPSFFQNDFANKSQNVIDNSGLDLWRKSTDLKFQADKFTNSLNDDILQISNEVYSGNSEALNNKIALFPLKEQQAKQIFGENEGQKLINDYKRKSLTSYVSTELYNDPAKAIETINLMTNNDSFKNLVEPKELENLKSQAQKRQKEMIDWNKNREVASYLTKNIAILNSIYSGDLKNYDDIIESLIQNNADKYTSQIILEQAGYDKDLPPNLLNNIDSKGIKNGMYDSKDNTNINLENKKIKLTESEKLQYKTNLKEKLLSLYDINEKDIENIDLNYDNIKELQNYILLGLKNGVITKEESMQLMNSTQPKLNLILATQTKKDLMFKDGWMTKGIGKKELDNTISELLIASKIPTKIDSTTKIKEIERTKYWNIKNKMYDFYLDEMNEKFIEDKKRNPLIKATTWQDYFTELDTKTRKLKQQEVLDKTIYLYATGLGIDKKRLLQKDENGKEEIISKEEIILKNIKLREEQLTQGKALKIANTK